MVGVYAAQTVSDRTEIDNDDANVTLLAGDLFGYQIVEIGNLDSLAAVDLAVIKLIKSHYGLVEKNYGVKVKSDKEKTIEEIALKLNLHY